MITNQMCSKPSSARRSKRPSTASLKSSLVTNPKPRSDKRVRFALDLNTIISPNRETSASIKSHQRVVDPWQQPGPLNDAYAEYLRKAESSNISNTEIVQISPAESITNLPSTTESSVYTHTFVVPSKPSESSTNALPQIVQQSTKPSRRTLPTIDSYLKQRLTISTPPRILPTRKSNTPTESHRPYLSVHTILKQLETPPSSSSSGSGDSRSSGRSLHADSFFHSKPLSESIQRAKINQLMNKSLSNGFHQMNPLLNERPILPNFYPKFRQPAYTPRTIDGFYINQFAVSVTNPYRPSLLPTILDPTR